MHEQPGLISLQRSQEPGSERSQADGKMFLFSSLKLFIKGSLLLRVVRDYGGPTLWFEKKRLWSLNDDIPRFLLYFLSLFFAIARRRLPRPSGLTIRGILRVAAKRKRGKESGRNCVNYSLISASDPWITSRRGYWSLSRFIERRFRNGAIGYEGTRGREDPPFTREKRFRRER